jgi:predicted AlkP superfamily phosphohydrolase/phosphomutase
MGRTNQTIVLGLDGIDAGFTRALMAAGRLPNMARLAAGHGFRRVLSTTPAESAVAWTSFNCGANPGRTNVFDFIERSPQSYAPRLAGSRVDWEPAAPAAPLRWGVATAAGIVTAGASASASRRISRRTWLRGAAAAVGGGAALAATGVALLEWVPRRAQRVRSTVDGDPWWDRAARRGERSVAARIPLTFPARARPEVRLLAGLGVPDVGGTNGTYYVLTDAADKVSRRRNVLPLSWRADECVVQIPGPENGLEKRGRTFAPLRIRRSGADTVVVWGLDGASQTVRRGSWSSWIPIEFEVSPIVSEPAVARLHFTAAGPGVTMYMTPVEFDSADPPARNSVSSPPAFAGELSAAVGRFRTIGWETQTWGLVDRVLEGPAYLTDLWATLDGNEAQFGWLLDRGDWEHLMFVVQATDQASHLFFDDAAVAMRDGAPVDAAHPLVRTYERADAIVGRAAAVAAARDCRLIVMSDHGFSRYRRAVNVNTFLAQSGWLALGDRGRWGAPNADAVLGAEPWWNVDWFNTRAYAIGLSGVYLNVTGREAQGIVQPGGEYEFLREKLAAALRAWCDPSTARPVLANVHRARDIYDGPHTGNAPDLVLGFNEGYRVSSASAVGGIPEESIVDNAGHWVADHCGIDAPLIPGICLTNFETGWPDLSAIEMLAGRIWPGL